MKTLLGFSRNKVLENGSLGPSFHWWTIHFAEGYKDGSVQNPIDLKQFR